MGKKQQKAFKEVSGSELERGLNAKLLLSMRRAKDGHHHFSIEQSKAPLKSMKTDDNVEL